MEIQKLLFVTKFEQLTFDALENLLALRKAGLEHIILLNVIQREKVALRRGTGYQKKEEIKLREMANIRFIDWAENLFEQGMEVGAYIVVGNLVKQVIDAAEKEGTDLIVIGRLQKGKIGQFYSGSDIMEIIRRAVTPVLVYKYVSAEGIRAERPFARPLLATDWSPASLKAIDYLKRLQGIIEEVNIIHVADEKRLVADSAMRVQATRRQAREKLDQICADLESAGINARPHVYVGQAVSEIETAARECRASMIITGIPVSGSWKERLVGSPSQTLAESSTLPTLLIPQVDK